MNSCRVLRKGSGVVFGQSVFHVVRRGPKTTPDPLALQLDLKGSGVVFGESAFQMIRRNPKTTPDPVRAAYHQTKSDSYCFAGPKEVR
jgi:hypothetical protein